MNQRTRRPSSAWIVCKLIVCKLAVITAVLFASTAQVASADIVIANYSDAANDRFAVDNQGNSFPNFIAANFNLSGIGQTSSGQWATAISRNVVITAAHAAPGIGSTINFYSDNNPNTAPVTSTLISGTRVGSTDLYLGVLSQPLPSSIVNFAYVQETLIGPGWVGNSGTIVAAGSLQGLNTYMFGRSPAAHIGSQDQAVGRNLITGYSENVSFLGNTDNDSILMIDDNFPTQGADFVQHEAYFQVGDSGGPTFVEINGELVLLGTNAFIFDGLDFQNVPFRGSGVNYTGNQAAFINNFIAINAITAVPEPSSMIMLALAGAVYPVRRVLKKRRANQQHV